MIGSGVIGEGRESGIGVIGGGREVGAGVMSIEGVR